MIEDKELLYDITYIENRINFFIADYIEQDPDNIDLYKSQSQFYDALYHCYKNMFRPNKPMKNNQKSIIDYRNIYYISQLIDIYIGLCSRYKRMITKHGFYKLIGIDENTLYKYINADSTYIYKDNKYTDTDNIPIQFNNINMGYSIDDKDKLSSFWKESAKKLELENEQSLRNRAFDNGNVTGTLAILNHDYGYNLPGVRERKEDAKQLVAREQVQQIASENIPKLPE